MATSTGALTRRQNNLPAVPLDLFQQIDQATAKASASFLSASAQQNIMAALELADGIEKLRQLFSEPEIQQRIQKLQDTPLGFRTDRDPSIINKKTGQPNKPYDWSVVREAVIEALLRGLQLVGNQFNIIAGRFYCTKEGFEALIKNQSAVANFKPIIGVPHSKSGGVIILCSATWLQNGDSHSLEVEIPVKATDSSTADQLMGKATRKFLSRCYQQMSGNSMPDGDAEVATVSISGADVIPLPSVAETAAHVATLTLEQQEQILTSIGRVLTETGVETFLKDMPQTFGVNELPEIPAEKFTTIMQGIGNNACRDRWNRGCSAKTGEQIITLLEPTDDNGVTIVDLPDAVEEELV